MTPRAPTPPTSTSPAGTPRRCVAAVGCVLTTLLAVRLVPAWPEMGRRYDAPPGRRAPAEPQGNLEIWKALDEGHDPTDRQRPLD